KTLSEILRLLWRNALSPHETKDGSPIHAAKLFQCFFSRRGFALRFQHHAPVRRRKRDRPPAGAGRISAYPCQRRHFISRAHATIQVRTCSKIKPALPQVALALSSLV